MTAQKLDWCRQNTFPLRHGNITFHGFMRAYSRWIPDKAKIQIIMLKSIHNSKDSWTIELRYGSGQQDWMSLTYDGNAEGKAFHDFLSIVNGWEEYDNKTFLRQVRTCLKNPASVHAFNQKHGSSSAE